MGHRISPLRAKVYGLEGIFIALSVALMFCITRFSHPWIVASGDYFYILAPLSLLLAIFLAVIALAGSVNFNSFGVMAVYVLAVSAICYSYVDYVQIVPDRLIYQIPVGLAIVGAVAFLFRLLLKSRLVANVLESLVATGFFFVLVREIGMFIRALLDFF